MEEMLDLVNEQGDPIGRAVPRSEAHRLGLRHRTSHVWLVRRKNGVLEVLLQKRSDEKDSFPGCYDISSAGHIPAGQGFVDSALRELKEELGVTAQPQDLILCGQRSFQFSAVFHIQHTPSMAGVCAAAQLPVFRGVPRQTVQG